MCTLMPLRVSHAHELALREAVASLGGQQAATPKLVQDKLRKAGLDITYDQADSRLRKLREKLCKEAGAAATIAPTTLPQAHAPTHMQPLPLSETTTAEQTQESGVGDQLQPLWPAVPGLRASTEGPQAPPAAGSLSSGLQLPVVPWDARLPAPHFHPVCAQVGAVVGRIGG